MILVQFFLIVVVLAVSAFVFFHFYKQDDSNSRLSSASEVLPTQARRLLEIFLFQRRSAEKYLILRDSVFLENFSLANKEFLNTLETISAFAKTSEEHALIEKIRSLQRRYSEGVTASGTQLETWKREREDLSDQISAAIQELALFGETRIHTIIEPGKKVSSWEMNLGWILASVFVLATVAVYLKNRKRSEPLKQLSQAMDHVGRGEFRQSLRPHGPREVAGVMRSFNRMIERLMEFDEMQGDFLAQMSHDLWTPISAIQEGVSLLLEEVPGSLNASQREIVQVVQGNSERLFRRLVSILDLSKMEAHKMEYALAPSDLVLLARRSIDAIGPLARKKQQQLTLHAPSPLPIFYVDEDRIRQVLDNLLNNAVKFTPENGAIRVSATFHSDSESGERWAEICVSDSGAGVPPEDTERIFLKFYQSSPSSPRAWRGSGLGLAIARHIIEDHGGRIWVESNPGSGATFIFTLPLRRGRENGQNGEGRTVRSRGRHVA